MTDKDILYEAIQKAEKNGWENERFLHPIDKFISDEIYDTFCDYQIIFSHGFAKAFFGNTQEEYWEEWRDKIGCCDGGFGYQAEWEHHLQQMVLESEPLSYLEKFL